MRVILVIVLCCVVSIQVTRSQRRRIAYQNPLRLRHVAALRQASGTISPLDNSTVKARGCRHGHDTDTVPSTCVLYRLPDANQQLGPVHFHGVIGKLPAKYMPLTKADEYAAFKASSIVPEITRYFPTVYTVNQMGPITVDLPDFWLRGKLYLNNLSIRGISQVSLQHLEMRMRNDRVDFNIQAPRISADVNFDLEGYLGVVPLYLSGSVSLGVQDLSPSGAVGTKKVTLPLVGEVYQVETADVSVDVQNISINIKNGSAGDLDQDMDSLKSQVLDDVKDEIADVLLSSALKEVNKELAKIPASEVIGFLTKNY